MKRRDLFCLFFAGFLPINIFREDSRIWMPDIELPRGVRSLEFIVGKGSVIYIWSDTGWFRIESVAGAVFDLKASGSISTKDEFRWRRRESNPRGAD